MEVIDSELFLCRSIEDWKIIQSHVRRILKPGGYVEYFQLDTNIRHSHKSVDAWAPIRDFSRTQGLMLESGIYMPSVLRNAGFSEIDVETAQIYLRGKDNLQQWSEAYVKAAFQPLVRFLTKAGWAEQMITVFSALTSNLQDCNSLCYVEW